MKVFEQENARRAVHLRNAETDIHLLIAPELGQFLQHRIIIQVREAA